MKLETPDPHFHYDFGVTPLFSLMFIVKLEESAIAMNLLGSAELIIVRPLQYDYLFPISRPHPFYNFQILFIIVY